MGILLAFLHISSLGPVIRFRKNPLFYFFYFSMLVDCVSLLIMIWFRIHSYSFEIYLIGNLILALSLPEVSKKLNYGLFLFIAFYFIINKTTLVSIIANILIILYISVYFINRLLSEIRVSGKISVFILFVIVLNLQSLITVFLFYFDIYLLTVYYNLKIVLIIFLNTSITICGPSKKVTFTYGYDPSIRDKAASELEIHVVEYGKYLDKGLTHREIQVFLLIKKGLTNTEIAEKLNIDKKTVESHLQHMKTKLGFTALQSMRGYLKGSDE